jgi:hypothetical protein
VRIFRADLIPLLAFSTAPGVTALKDMFHFNAVTPGEDGIDFVVLQGGLFHDDSGNVAAINALHLNDRRIVLDVRGDSDTASAVFRGIWAAITSVATDPALRSSDPPEPVVMTEECKSVSTLDFDWGDLFSPKVGTFWAGDGLTDALSSDRAEAAALGFAMGLRVRYEVKDRSILESGASLSEKVVRLETRVGTARNDRRFFAQTPTGSEEHVRILEALEKTVSGRAR